MDLHRRPPRSPREKLAGYVHLGRMFDKCRAALNGTLGEYIYPCPMDQRVLDYAGITVESFTEAVKAASSDEEVADWFRSIAKPHSELEMAEFNEMMLTHGPDSPEDIASFNKVRDAVDASRTDITSFADLLDLQEGRPVPRRG